jgi:AAA+ superfamily predicted ATPase
LQFETGKFTDKEKHEIVGIKSVESVGVDDFYGFTVDKDHLYVMDDFWITHNCGKSSLIRTMISMYNFKPVTIVPGADDGAIREAFSYAEEQSPSLLFFEDLDSILEKNDISSFLNLMDGISAKNGLLVVATANDIKKLKSSITDRPSRFDRKFEIPLPDQEMASIYLKKWFGNLITSKKCKELAKYTEKYQLSYAYLKDIYISSMFEALSNNRKTPTDKDIDSSLARLVKEKNILSGKPINMDKYFK